jgi:signal transduction histidine kinase
MNEYVTLYLFLIFSGSISKAQVLIDSADSYSLDGQVLVFKEGKKVMSFEEALSQYKSRKFTSIKSPDNKIKIGYAGKAYWFAIPVKNRLNTTQRLEADITNCGIYEIEFYATSLTTGKVISKCVTGMKYTFNTTENTKKGFYFPFELEPTESAVLFYRIRDDYPFVPLQLIKDKNIRFESYIRLFHAFFSGCSSFVLLLSLIIFAFTRERIYLWYSLYIIFYLIGYWLDFLADTNFNFKWLYLGRFTPFIYSYGFHIFMLLFMIDFLQLKLECKKLYRISTFWILVLIIAIVLLGVHDFLNSMSWKNFISRYLDVAFLGAWVIKIISIIVRLKDKYKPANLYAVGQLGMIICFVISIAQAMRFIRFDFPSYIGMATSFFMEIIMMSFALVYSYNYFKKQQQELLLSITHKELEFNKTLLEVQTAEQKRIADDLHDELGGDLAAIKMKLQNVNFPDEIRRDVLALVKRATESTRTIAHNLMPPDFLETDLLALLEERVQTLNQSGTIHFKLFKPSILTQFDKRKELAVYRIIMEIINNIIKHSGAKEATIQLINYETGIEIMIEDNGKGFDANVVSGLGLKSINTRVNILEGSMNIDSNIRGTTILIKIPKKRNLL